MKKLKDQKLKSENIQVVAEKLLYKAMIDLPPAIHSLGGKMALSISSCLGILSMLGFYPFGNPPLLELPPNYLFLKCSLGSTISIGGSCNTKLSRTLPSCILFYNFYYYYSWFLASVILDLNRID